MFFNYVQEGDRMRMKNVLFIILAVVIFSCCGGHRHRPETEPVEPGEETVEEFQQQAAEIETAKKQEEAEAESTKKEVEQAVPREQVEVEPIKDENIPVITPEKKPGKIETTEIIKPEDIKVTDHITAGIGNISKEFGYAGDIDVPNSFKQRVAYYIRYFSGKGKGARFFRRAMTRGEKYLPMIKKVLEKKHLPVSLAYLPVIESGFKSYARSRAGAVGMWQFMRGTARMYGLKVWRKTDERKDPVKSTHAAAEYLNDLLAMFGMEDPFLGICAYNAGEGKIMRALRKISYRERSFWTLVKKNLLRNETDEYIPRLLAVILIAHNPAKYIAASNHISLEENEAEDQEILNTLHSSKDDFSVDGKDKVSGADESVIDINMNAVETGKETVVTTKPSSTITKSPPRRRPTVTPSPSVYRVKRGDSLYRIARRFKVSVRNLKRWNKLRRSRIYPGQKLKIYGSSAKISKRTAAKTGRYKLIYTVNYTDSLARIALFFRGVNARDIMRWNNLRRSRIYPRQKLKLFLKKPPRKVVTYIVRRGDNAHRIARKHRVRVEYVLSLNGLVTNSRLRPGKRLKIYYF